MTEYREILRLNALGLSGRSIAGSVSRSRNTIADVLSRAGKLGLEWPLPLEMTDIELDRMLYPEKSGGGSTAKTPDFEKIHRELAHPGVTMTLLWDEHCNECREAGEIPYQYSQYCKMYRKFAVVSKATMHIARKPGEQMEVDWAAQTSFIREATTGKDIPAYVFVAVLPASQYAYVEAFATQNMESWITAHIHAFFHFGGVPRIIVPDNLKTGVDKPGWYTPVINKTYHEMAEHYGTAIVPARVRRPKDKPSVEGTVGHVSTWIIAALRHGTFFSIPELNAEIKHKLAVFNERPFQKRPGSRKSVFLEEERAMLFELPVVPYEIASWKKATVAYNYHICIDGGYYYSVPYEYIKYQVDVRITSRMVEVFYKGVRICSHPKPHGPLGQYRTIDDHMPPKHRASGEWNAERFISWGRSIGTNTEEVIRSLLSRYKVEQQGYRSCMGVLKMADKYSVERLESACARALSYTPQPSYKNIAAILKSGQDKANVKTQTSRPVHENESHSFIRGAEYYGGGSDAE
jgi:transposase